MVASSRNGPVSNREWRQWSHMLHNWKKTHINVHIVEKQKKEKKENNKNKNVHFVRLRDIKAKQKKITTQYIYIFTF